MAKGKFSNPRPYREEEREIEKSFRQLTGQDPQPVKSAEDEILDSIPVSTDPVADASAPVPEISDPIPELEEEFWEEDEPQEQSLLDTVLDFVNNNRKPVLVGACALALVLIVSIIIIFCVGSASDPYDGKILNNVTVAGVNVGGMTKAQAINAVETATERTFGKQDMVIELGDTTLRLSPEDTEAALDVKAAVNAAYDYGRTGTKSEKEAAYEASLRSNHTIGLLPYLELNETYIRGVLEEYAADVGSILTQASYEIEGDIPALETDKFSEPGPKLTLVLTMGTPGVNFDIDGLYDQILDAYSLNCFLVEVEDADPAAEPDPVDLQAIFDEVCVPAVDATMDMQTYEAIPGSYGYEFDIDAAQKLVNKAKYGDIIRIEMEYVAPEIMDGDVFFRDVLGSCETPHSNNANRTSNLKLACKALDGLVLYPGDTFSYNEALGERTTAKGYKSAPAYVDNKLVDSVGGGICQVSSTLYCSTLVADLEIVTRTNHSFPVSYIDYGMDATVSWGSPDFKFRNNTNYPIKIEAEVSDGYVKIQILGTDEKDYYIEMSYVITNTYKPETEYEEFEYNNAEGYLDGDVIQEGTTGYYVKTYKNKYSKETGALLSKDFVANSQYKTVNKIVARVEPAPTEAPTKPTEPTTIPTEPTTTPTEPSGGDNNTGGDSSADNSGSDGSENSTPTDGSGTGGEGGSDPAPQTDGSEIDQTGDAA